MSRMSRTTDHTVPTDPTVPTIPTVPAAPAARRPDEIGTIADAVIRAHQELTDAAARLRRLGTGTEGDARLLQKAADANEAVVELEAEIIAAASRRLRIASSPRELGETLDEVAASWRARAQDLVVQARLGKMEVDDAVTGALTEFEEAGDHLSELISTLRTHDTAWSDELRDHARVVVDDVRSAVSALLRAVER